MFEPHIIYASDSRYIPSPPTAPRPISSSTSFAGPTLSMNFTQNASISNALNILSECDISIQCAVKHQANQMNHYCCPTIPTQPSSVSYSISYHHHHTKYIHWSQRIITITFIILLLLEFLSFILANLLVLDSFGIVYYEERFENMAYHQLATFIQISTIYLNDFISHTLPRPHIVISNLVLFLLLFLICSTISSLVLPLPKNNIFNLSLSHKVG